MAAGVYWVSHRQSTYGPAARAVREAIPRVMRAVLPVELAHVFPQSLAEVFAGTMIEVFPQSFSNILPSAVTGLSYPIDVRIVREREVPDTAIALVSNVSAHAPIQEFVVPSGASWYAMLRVGVDLDLMQAFDSLWEDAAQ